MMSEQEQRQAIINENIPELIKALTGFNEDEINYQLCLDYAYSRIASDRQLSVNSHEVRRRIEGLAERFTASNYTAFSERLTVLCNSFTSDPICDDHYETDIQWSVLQLLLELSKNPVTALIEHKHEIPLVDRENDDDMKRRLEHEEKMNDLIHSLIEVNDERHDDALCDAESELSEWSDDDVFNDKSEIGTSIVTTLLPETSVSEETLLRPVTIVSELQPPQRYLPFITFDGSNSLEWLRANVQHSWWQDSHYQEPVVSQFESAHYNRIHYERILKTTNIAIPPASITNEWCLLREVFWMLLTEPPTRHDDSAIGLEPKGNNFKYFHLDVDKKEITVKQNVSLASVTTEGTQDALLELTEYMTMFYRLRHFIRTILCPNMYCSSSTSFTYAPNTIQTYAIALESLLHPLVNVILEKEQEIVRNEPFEKYTLIRFYCEMKLKFARLEYLYEIHSKCYIDYSMYPHHITSMYLIASLKHKITVSFNVEYANLAASLFLFTIKYYYHVLGKLWNRGRLDDWESEFLVENVDSQQGTYQAKSYDLSVIGSKLSPNYKLNRTPQFIYNTIQKCTFLKLLTELCLDAGYALSIVCNLNLLPRMLSTFNENTIKKCLYSDFIDRLMIKLRKFNSKEKTFEASVLDIPVGGTVVGTSEFKQPNNVSTMDPTKLLADQNPLLYLIFEQTFKLSGLLPTDPEEPVDYPFDAKVLFNEFTEITEIFLPFLPNVMQITTDVLQARISIANQYTLNIYLNEFDIMRHILNLQKVYLLGAGDSMLAFYSSLFEKINSGEHWSNPYLLTVQLDGIFCIQYPKLSSLFSLQLDSVACEDKLPLDAIKCLTVTYNVQEKLRAVLHKNSLRKYNAVFRFLMEVKWAIWTLETQRFPVQFKKSRHYRKMNMYDLIFKRLALARNWIIYSIQNIHSYLMMFVVQSMGQQLAKRMSKCQSLQELIDIHDLYIQTIYEHCFQTAEDEKIRVAIEHLLSLVSVLNDEWKNVELLDPDNMVVDKSMESTRENIFDISSTCEQVDEIETTFINCHSVIADILSQEVYAKQREDLAGLSAAFNCSLPC